MKVTAYRGNDDGNDRCVTCLDRRKSDDGSNGMSRACIWREGYRTCSSRQLLTPDEEEADPVFLAYASEIAFDRARSWNESDRLHRSLNLVVNFSKLFITVYRDK